MAETEDDIQALRQLAQDYRSVVDLLKTRGWVEEQRQPEQGLVTSTELAPAQSDGRYIAISFELPGASRSEAGKTVTVQLVTRTPDNDRIRIFKAADLAQLGREKALESFSATVFSYADELEE